MQVQPTTYQCGNKAYFLTMEVRGLWCTSMLESTVYMYTINFHEQTRIFTFTLFHRIVKLTQLPNDHCLMSDKVISTLCANFELSCQELDKVISDLHLDKIAQTRCTYWQSLPSRLGLPDIIANDIDKDFSKELDKRREFFHQWKQIKGSEATYRNLVKALLDFSKRLDAEYVLKLLHQAVTDYNSYADGSGTQVFTFTYCILACMAQCFEAACMYQKGWG